MDIAAVRPVPLAAAFVVPAGVAAALVGPSGAGKTSLLRAIAGLLPATGTVRVGGQAWQDGAVGLPARQRRVGLMFQDGALFPHLSALANVMEAMVGAPDAEARGLALLDRMGLAALADRRPGQLSGGQQSRVALARALARQPDVLLLDEPFAAVDRPVRRGLFALIAEIRRELAVPILFVTHEVEEAAAIADHYLLMIDGALVEQGPTTLLDDPASRLRRWLDGAA